MSDSFSSVLLILMYFVLPICLITYGLLNKRNTTAWYLLIVGCFFISCPLSLEITPKIATVICSFLSIFGISAYFSDTITLSIILTVLLVFIEYKTYKVFVYWESIKYTGVVSDIIQSGQSNELPDCSKIVMRAFRERILYHFNKKDGKNDPEYAAKQLYYAITDMLTGSTYYSAIDNKLTDDGNQLLNVRIACVNRLVEKGIIQDENKEDYYYLRNVKL